MTAGAAALILLSTTVWVRVMGVPPVGVKVVASLTLIDLRSSSARAAAPSTQVMR